MTRTSVQGAGDEQSGARRLREMFSGAEVTDEARAQAARLLEAA